MLDRDGHLVSATSSRLPSTPTKAAAGNTRGTRFAMPCVISHELVISRRAMENTTMASAAKASQAPMMPRRQALLPSACVELLPAACESINEDVGLSSGGATRRIRRS